MGRDLLDGAVGGAVELVGEPAEILDQPVPLLGELLDVPAHLAAVAVGLLTAGACLIRRLLGNLLGLRSRVAQYLLGVRPHLGAVAIGLLAQFAGARIGVRSTLAGLRLGVGNDLLGGLARSAQDCAGFLAHVRQCPLDDGIRRAHRLEFDDDPRHSLHVLVDLGAIVAAPSAGKLDPGDVRQERPAPSWPQLHLWNLVLAAGGAGRRVAQVVLHPREYARLRPQTQARPTVHHVRSGD